VTEIDKHGQPVGLPLVGKESLYENESDLEFHWTSGIT